MNISKALLAGLIAGSIAFVFGSGLYMNPLVAGIYDQYKNLPGTRSMEVFGGLSPWLALMALGGIVSTMVNAVIYAVIHKSLPGKIFSRGIIFGLFIWLIGTLPASYYTYLMRDYPNVLLFIEVFNGLADSVVAGLIVAWVYGSGE